MNTSLVMWICDSSFEMIKPVSSSTLQDIQQLGVYTFDYSDAAKRSVPQALKLHNNLSIKFVITTSIPALKYVACHRSSSSQKVYKFGEGKIVIIWKLGELHFLPKKGRKKVTFHVSVDSGAA